MHFAHLGRSRGARAQTPLAYRRHDLVRCDDCLRVFLASSNRVACPRCGSERLRALST